MVGKRPNNLSYEAWVEHVFGHEVPLYDVAWYHQDNADWWEPTPTQAIDYVTRLFERPEPLVEEFADSQIGQGLYYIIDNGAGAYCRFLIDGSVPVRARTDCIAAMKKLFARLFDTRCAPILSHLDEPGGNKLSSVCYMWWDIIPLAASSKPSRPDPIHEACLAVMKETLRLSNPACQENALHGIGHWSHAYPEFAAETIDQYLTRRSTLRPELIRYAEAARVGCIA
jgi:hypothetical protein